MHEKNEDVGRSERGGGGGGTSALIPPLQVPAKGQRLEGGRGTR